MTNFFKTTKNRIWAVLFMLLATSVCCASPDGSGQTDPVQTIKIAIGIALAIATAAAALFIIVYGIKTMAHGEVDMKKGLSILAGLACCFGGGYLAAQLIGS